MIAAFLKTLSQLPDPAFRRVLLRGLGLTLVTFVVLVLVVLLALIQLPVPDLSWLPDFVISWLSGLIKFAGVAALLLVLFLLFPAIATLFISAYLDDIADAVDARYYAMDPPGKSLKLGPSLLVAARYSGAVLVVNVLALPVYGILTIIAPPINLFVFYGLNGYLLSREYFDLVALRHLDVVSAGRLREANRGKLTLAGVVIAILLTVPVVNIIAPVVATAFMEHIFKDLSVRGGGVKLT